MHRFFLTTVLLGCTLSPSFAVAPVPPRPAVSTGWSNGAHAAGVPGDPVSGSPPPIAAAARGASRITAQDRPRHAAYRSAHARVDRVGSGNVAVGRASPTVAAADPLANVESLTECLYNKVGTSAAHWLVRGAGLGDALLIPNAMPLPNACASDSGQHPILPCGPVGRVV
jgi:hypothetical protein